MMSFGDTFVPNISTTLPFTNTFPAFINSSDFLLEAIPDAAITFYNK